MTWFHRYARDHGLREVSCIPFSREVKENGIRGVPPFLGLEGSVLYAIEELRSGLCKGYGCRAKR